MASPQMQKCIEDCLACYQTCLSMAMGYCLEVGGAHAQKAHLTQMMGCAEICRTAAYFMLIGSDHHAYVCAECAEVCDQCAKDCKRLSGLEPCVAACEKCAASCREMAIPMGSRGA